MAAGEATFTAAHSLSPPSSVGETYMAERPRRSPRRQVGTADSGTDQALTAERRLMSLGTHHGAFSLIATDLLGGRPRIERVIISAARVKFPVMVSSRSSIGLSDMRLAASGTSLNVHVGHGLNGDDHDARCGRETHIDH
jgi:hypothetical protein